MEKNTALGLLPELGKEWRVSFEFRPTNYSLTADTNLLQLTSGAPSTEHGSMTPTISFLNGWNGITEMIVKSSMSSHTDKLFHINTLPKIGEWTKIEVDQRQEGCSYFFVVSIANKELFQRQNQNPRKFSNVAVFASNPEDEAQPGSIRNLVIMTSAAGELLEKWNNLFIHRKPTDPCQCYNVKRRRRSICW